MKTYLKHRYSTSLDTDLLDDGELPEHKNIWVLNTARFASVMTQTGTYKVIDADQEELEIQKETANMIRPSLDISSVHRSILKTETESWGEEFVIQEQKSAQLPYAVLRPNTPKNFETMRGVTAQVGQDLNSQPDQERILRIPDDATIVTSQATTAKIRRQSDYAPTEKVSLRTDNTDDTSLRLDIGRQERIQYQPSTSSEDSDVYRPVTRPSNLATNNREDPFHTVVEDYSILLHRTSGTFNGVYFPCMGIFCGPLFGTDIFPLPPRQEKYHFNLVMDKPTDHYDGNPNSAYEDQVRRYMQKPSRAFERTNLRFNSQQSLTANERNWNLKFPFSSQRFGVQVQAASKPDYIFQPVEYNQHLLTKESDHFRPFRGGNTPKSTVTGQHNPVTPTKSQEKLLERRNQLNVNKLKIFIGEAEFHHSETLTAYDKFNEVVKAFRKNGGTFKQPTSHIRKATALITEVQSVTDMQVWLAKNQGKHDFNSFHEAWYDTPILRRRMLQSDKAKLSSFMFNCLEYHNFVQFRNTVSLK